MAAAAENGEVQATAQCRICGQTNENFLQIFQGEGLENNLADKIHTYLPIKVTTNDALPLQSCFQCASTLIAWHRLYQNCIVTNNILNTKLDKNQSPNLPSKSSDNDNNVKYPNSNKKRSTHCTSFCAYHHAQSTPHHPPQLMLNPSFDTGTIVQNHFTEADFNIPLDNSDIKKENMTVELLRNVVNNSVSNILEINFAGIKNDSIFRKHSRAIQDIIFKLKNHIRQNHLDRNENSDVDIDDGDDDKPLSELQSQKSINSDENGRSDYETENIQFPCTRCTFVTSDKDVLDRHTQNNHNRAQNLFKRSSRRIYDLKTRQELDSVMVNTEGKVHYKCKICNRHLTSAYSYVLHKTIHSGQKLFTCQICGRKFRLMGFLKKHLLHMHSMRGKRDLNKASTDVGSHKAEPKRSYLDYKAIERAKIVVNGNVYYKCELCDKQLTRVNYYLSHMTIHTGEKKFVCHLCGKTFRLSTMLKIHLRLTHERIKNFDCNVCHQKFGTKMNLSEHQHIHTGERPHVCAQCGKSFKQKSALFVHNRSHTNYFPFKCLHCDAKFRIQSQLNYHMIKHTGERPFSCNVCGKGFAIKGHLNRHIKNHVEGRPFRCTECTKDFRHKKNLTSHLKNCHKISS